QVDLGSVQSFNQVQLAWETAYASSYQVQTSPDGVTWTTVYATTSGNGGFDNLAITGTGRYVRMNGQVRAARWGYSLYGVGVYRGSTFRSQSRMASMGSVQRASSMRSWPMPGKSSGAPP